jgi:hypothetical protein
MSNAPKFSVGDVIRNKDTYPGEHSHYIAKLFEHGYKTHWLRGKHCKEPDFYTFDTIRFDEQDKYYRVTGGSA